MRSPQSTADNGAVGKGSQSKPVVSYNFTYAYDYTESKESCGETIDAYFLLTRDEIDLIGGSTKKEARVFFKGNYYSARPYGIMYVIEMNNPNNWEGDKFSIRLILKKIK